MVQKNGAKTKKAPSANEEEQTAPAKKRKEEAKKTLYITRV